MNIRASIQRNVWVQIEMTEKEAEEFYKASVPEAVYGIEVASFIDRIRNTIHNELHTTSANANAKAMPAESLEQHVYRTKGGM